MAQNKQNCPKNNITTSLSLDIEALMGNLPGMVYRCRNDKDWTMEYVSAGCRELTGFSASQLVNNSYVSYGRIIHPDDRDMVWKEVNCGLDEDRAFRVMYRINAEGGREKWVLEQGQGIFDKHHKLIAIEGFITDVSEHKKVELKLEKALYQKKMIIAEIHHRIKNNMQQIISMLSLQSSHEPDCSELLDAIIERINIFSEMHHELYSYDNRDLVNLSGHIERNFQNLLDSYGFSPDRIVLKLDIPEDEFEFDTAIPLGLMLNELISNSMKHAFDESSGWIEFRLRKDCGGGISEMVYSDSGVDFEDAGGGFGLVLLKAFASQLGLEMDISLKGNVKYIFRKQNGAPG